jgi:hypothetical protein
MDNITYDVRIWKTEIYKGAKVTTYKVRWRTGPRRWKQPFRRKAQAASFEAELRLRLAEVRRSISPPAAPSPGLGKTTI